MNFELTEEQQLLRDAVRGFAERHLRDGALARAHASEYPFDVARLLAGQGLLGIAIAEADGGQGGTLMDAVIAIEQVALVCPRSADVIQAGNFGAIRVLAEFGNAEQKQRLLAPLLRGEGVISVGMSEPEAGSAVTDLVSSLRAEGDGYRLNGAKVFTTHSTHADLFLVYARFGPGIDGIGSVLVEKGMPGFTLGEPVAYLSDETWAQLYFDEVFIPAANVLLGPGGFKRQIAGFNVERIGNSTRAMALGMHAFELARRHALERRQFGRALCEFQGLQWKFAECAVELEAARLLLYRAACNADRGFPSAQETSMAKLACNQAGFRAANEAVQVMGATGYSKLTLAEYCLRRTRGWMIAGGSLEMMKNRIAEGVFDRRFGQRPPRI